MPSPIPTSAKDNLLLTITRQTWSALPRADAAQALVGTASASGRSATPIFYARNRQALLEAACSPDRPNDSSPGSPSLLRIPSCSRYLPRVVGVELAGHARAGEPEPRSASGPDADLVRPAPPGDRFGFWRARWDSLLRSPFSAAGCGSLGDRCPLVRNGKAAFRTTRLFATDCVTAQAAVERWCLAWIWLS